MIRDIRTLFEEENEYFKPIKVGKIIQNSRYIKNFSAYPVKIQHNKIPKTFKILVYWNNSYIEYESKGNENKNLSVK